MPVYRVLDQAALIALARERGWLAGPTLPGSEFEELAPVEFFSAGSRGTLPPVRVENQRSLLIRIPNAIVHGGNFSLIIDGCIYPGGFVHSFWPSPAWKPAGEGGVRYDPHNAQRLAVQSPSLLGMISHWGHFFVDALDRLFHLEELNRLDTAMLVSDPDFLNLRPTLDERHAVPQVSELMSLLGAPLPPGNIIPVLKKFDYEVSDLTVCTLRSVKPAISADSFRKLRRRLQPRIDAAPVSDRVLFVGRRDIKKRFIVNQQALVDHLAAVHRAVTVFPEQLSMAQAIGSFAAASRVILPVGSAKFNLAFCRPGAAVVCVTPRGYAAQNAGVVIMTRHLCHALGLKLAFYEVEIAGRHPMVLNSNIVISEADASHMIGLLDDMATHAG
jgi:hypothetical protein